MRVERDDNGDLRWYWNDGTPFIKLLTDGNMVVARGDHPLDARQVMLNDYELGDISKWADDALEAREARERRE